MIALVRSELRKMTTTRTNLGLLLGLVGLVLFGVLSGGLAGSESDLAQLENQRSLIGNGAWSAIFASLIGLLAMTSEFRHGTISATFVFTPGRARVVSAKVAASLLVGAGFGALGVCLALGAGAAMIRGRGFDLLLDAGDVRQALLGGIAMSALWAAFGVGIGAVLRNQVLAIVGIFSWIFIVEIVVSQYLPGVARYLPVTAGTALTGDAMGDASVQLLPAAAGGALLTAYAAAFVLGGALVVARRDVT